MECYTTIESNLSPENTPEMAETFGQVFLTEASKSIFICSLKPTRKPCYSWTIYHFPKTNQFAFVLKHSCN